MKIDERKLPQGWADTRLADIAQTIRGVTYKKEESSPTPGAGLIPLLRATNINTELDFNEPVYVPRNNVRGEQVLRKGDILIAASSGSRAIVGKAAILWTEWEGTFGAFCYVLRPSKLVSAKLIAYFLQTSEYRNQVSQLSAGVNINNLRREHIEQIVFRLPPKEEQRRIVEELEKQFTRLDFAFAAISRLRANLKRYRAAILSAACEGRLVPTEATLADGEGHSYEPASVLLDRILNERRAQWEGRQRTRLRAQGRLFKDADLTQKYPLPVQPDALPSVELPSGWCFASLSQLSWDASYGTSQKCDYGWPGPPVLRIPNIVGGRIDLSDVKNAAESSELDEADALALNDMLIVRTNGSRDLIGRSAVIERPFERPYFYASYLIRFRLVNVDALSAWIRTMWDAPMNRLRIEAMAATTAGQYNVNVAKLSRLPIPLAPVGEMRRIAVELERRLSVIDEVESEVDANLRRSNGLRQAILIKAFEGSLTPQDPNDEPATLLLNQISAERLASRTITGTTTRENGEDLPMTKHLEKPRESLLNALKQTKKGMSPEELFHVAGFVSDEIDDFYAELKAQIELGQVEELRTDRTIMLRAKAR